MMEDFQFILVEAFSIFAVNTPSQPMLTTRHTAPSDSPTFRANIRFTLIDIESAVLVDK